MTPTGTITSGITKIPVRNLWLLMLYASRLYQRDKLLRERGVEENPEDLFDLITDILITAIERRLQRSLGRQYHQRTDTLTRVRGQIDVLATESRKLLAQGRVACRFAELTANNQRNRLLHTALVIAARRTSQPALKQRARRLTEVLTQYGVSPQLVSAREAGQVTLGRNDRDDVEAIDAARLLISMNIPAEHDGKATNREPERHAAEVRRLYEAAVRGFYKVSLPPEWTVAEGETRHRWPVSEATDGLHAVLPVMKTDIVLETSDHRVIIETKFADALKPNQYDSVKLSRNHIFQLYAYVQSQHERDHLSSTAEGVLLYPVVGQHLCQAATIQGHRYRFMTVDLGSSAASIRDALLRIVRDVDVPR